MNPIEQQLKDWYSTPTMIVVAVGALCLLTEGSWMLWVVLGGH